MFINAFNLWISNYTQINCNNSQDFSSSAGFFNFGNGATKEKKMITENWHKCLTYIIFNILYCLIQETIIFNISYNSLIAFYFNKYTLWILMVKKVKLRKKFKDVSTDSKLQNFHYALLILLENRHHHPSLVMYEYFRLSITKCFLRYKTYSGMKVNQLHITQFEYLIYSNVLYFFLFW